MGRGPSPGDDRAWRSAHVRKFDAARRPRSKHSVLPDVPCDCVPAAMTHRPHMRLRFSEMPIYIGEVAAPEFGSPESLPTPRSCDCIITKTGVEGLFDVALCEKHAWLGPKL